MKRGIKMDQAKKLRQEILEKTKDLYKLEHEKKQKDFKLGEQMIPFAGRVYDEEELVNLVDSSLDFWLTAGRYADDFEAEFADYMDQKKCILVNSGSSANLIALTALTSPKLGEKALKPGDEVITVAAGFPTTVNPIIQNNLIPVFVDVELGTYNIDVKEMEKALSEKTKAVMIAHTLGNPFDLKSVTEFCKKNDLYLIEDCCDAVGSTYNGQMVGTFGDLATTSFYPAHHMTMGEGGAVLTNNSAYAKLAICFRDWGRDCYCGPGSDNSCGRRFKGQYGTLPYGYEHKYVYSHIGYNLKVTDMQAAVGMAQLKKLSNFVEARKVNFKKLWKGLEEFQEYLILPKAKGKTTHQQNASVSITKNGAYYVNKERVSEQSMESELNKVLAGQETPTIILRAEEGVPIEDAVFVMDIANKNNYKVVLAVRPN